MGIHEGSNLGWNLGIAMMGEVLKASGSKGGSKGTHLIMLEDAPDN